MIGRGASDIVKHIKVSKQIGAISNKAQSIASMSAKNKSLAIWNMVGADNFSRNAFKSWGYNQIFDRQIHTLCQGRSTDNICDF